MSIKQIRKWRILCVFALFLFLLCLSPAQGLGQKGQPAFRFYRKAQVQDGKKQEAIKFARDLVEYVNSSYTGVCLSLFIEDSGGATSIHWFADYKDFSTYESINSQLMLDKRYMAFRARAPSLLVEGSVQDTLLAAVSCFEPKDEPASETQRPSWTAESNAALRAIAAKDPDDQVRNPDYMAAHFVSDEFWSHSPLSPDFEAAKDVIRTYGINGYYSVNARTKHIDSLLKEALKEGVKQVVILGAGFDSRAYRFKSLSDDVRFFEVDLPATIHEKKKRVRNILGELPKGVVYVPIDFNRQTLTQVLDEGEYNEEEKTFYIWEGVTMYLREAGVTGTLDFISRHSAPGSSVVFDYVLRRVIEGDGETYKDCTRVMRRMAERGESWIFGLDREEAKVFVNQLGFQVLSDLGSDELTKRYLVRSDGTLDGRALICNRILHAKVTR
ncbi:MAG: SAM-dependent methyltransferase [Deltaproteobacteria bacterium]|nr:SAM-dependent methyltransferase [Deltaproteobacteria bacterium]